MRSVLYVILLASSFLLSAGCTEVSPGDEPVQTAQGDTATSERVKCKPERTRVKGNFLRMRKEHRLVSISLAGDTLTGSHRLLEVFDTRTCTLLDSILLPQQSDPDFPYLLADINFNQSSHLIGIKGYDRIYCYDLDDRALLPALVPEYPTERPLIDAQSRQIRHLEVWEHYLVGYAQDCGTFVFDLAQPDAPAAVLPVAEYKITDGNYGQLFLLPSAPDGSAQLLLPIMTVETGLEVNPILARPRPLRENVVRSAANNRYIIIRDTEGHPVAMDLAERSRVSLGPDLRNSTNEQILDFLRNR